MSITRLLDNDTIERHLRQHLEEAFGRTSQERYWEIFEQFRAELGYADYLGALQRYRIEHPRDPHLLPAVLVRVDGEPEYQRVAGTTLERIVNTTWPMVRHESGMHYLKLGDTWFEADALTGSWSIAGTIPAGTDSAAHQRVMQSPTSTPTLSLTGGLIPEVHVSLMPAELVLTSGEPEYVPIRDTSLLRVQNSRTPIFKEPTDKELYVHVASRWFRAWMPMGPWEPVVEDALPADLRNAVASTPHH